MNLSIEDLEAIKALIREVVSEELARVIREAQEQQAVYTAATKQRRTQPVASVSGAQQ